MEVKVLSYIPSVQLWGVLYPLLQHMQPVWLKHTHCIPRHLVKEYVPHYKILVRTLVLYMYCPTYSVLV